MIHTEAFPGANDITDEHLQRYVVIEGIDGVGKTTQRDRLAYWLTSQGETVVTPIEPGGTPIGQAIREVLLNHELERSPETNMDLFMIARRELAAQVIGPTLLLNQWVVADRSKDSTIAYQGYGEGMDIDLIVKRAKQALGPLAFPRKTVIIDVPEDIALDRIKHKNADFFERKGVEFFKRVREGYHRIAEDFDILMVDGTKTINEVHAAILKALSFTPDS